MSLPKDKKLYNKTKQYIYKKYPKHSAYRSGLLVQEYKKRFSKKNMEKIKIHIKEKNRKKRFRKMV